MADQRFFNNAGPFQLAELAAKSGATVAPDGDPDLEIADVAPLETAGPGQLSFLDNRKYLKAFETTAANACIVHPNLASRAPDGISLLLSEDPYRTYALCAQAFYPLRRPEPGIARTATVVPNATLGADCQVGPGVCIGPGVVIGANCRIGPNVVISRGVTIGDNALIGANATLGFCDIGDRVIIHPGVCIGQDGFGFAMGPAGHLKVPQLGRVRIGANVEIGAGTTIDRGTGPDTVIGDGCKIDNLVQIGHNVQMGVGCVIVAQVGIAGSTKLGNFVAVGGQVGLTGHLNIGAGAQIAARSGVMRDIPAGSTVAGAPAAPIKDYMRQITALANLAKRKK